MPSPGVPEATPFGGGSMSDPLQMLNSLTEFQNRMNQNRQFQAQFMGNQAVGETIAHAGSLEDGLKQVEQNPLAMGFGSEAYQTAKAARLLELQGAEVKSKLRSSGWEAASNASTLAMMDPQNADQHFNDAKKMIDPSVINEVGPLVDATKQMYHTVTAGVNWNDPAQAQQAKSKVGALFGGALGAAGASPDHVAQYMGTMRTNEKGQVGFEPGIFQQIPGQSGPVNTSSIPQQQSQTPLMSVNPVDNTRTYPIDTNTAKSYFMQNPDGSVQSTIYGQPKYKTDNYDASDKQAQNEFNTKGADAFESARNMYNTATQLEAAGRDLSERGGFQVQGFLGKMRGQFSNMLETASNMGLISQTAAQAADTAIKNQDIGEINKQAGTLIFTLKDSLDPGAKSLGALMEAATMVPGMDNTPLQFMTLISGLKGLAAWKAGEYQFKNDYLRNNNTLLGSDSAYANVTSQLKETNKELNKNGMEITADNHFRFLNDDAAIKAFSQGMLGPRNKENLGRVFITGILGDINSDKAADIYRTIRANLNAK